MNFRMTKSSAVMEHMPSIDLTKVKQRCKTKGIDLSIMGEVQLQTAYAMKGFKAHHTSNSKIAFIFISLYTENEYMVNGYIQGKKLLSDICQDQLGIAQTIARCISMSHIEYHEDMTGYFKEFQQLFTALNRKSQTILKKSNNQMMAVQEIKSSQQYIDIGNAISSLSLDVQDLCKQVNSVKARAQEANKQLVANLLEIEKVKRSVQEQNLKYEEVKNSLGDVDQMLNKFIQTKKKNIQSKQFYDQDSFSRYLDSLVDIKKMENQKRFLAK